MIRQMLDDIITDNIAQAVRVQSLRPRIACCRQGPGSPAASARIQRAHREARGFDCPEVHASPSASCCATSISQLYSSVNVRNSR
jgi:hypothetical protein